MAKLICGIDPGMSGALALLADGELVEVADMPVIEVHGKRRPNAAAAAEIVIRFNAALTVIEQVGAMPRQGVASTFAFGYGAGVLEGIHAALGRAILMVRPNVWKREANVPADKGAARMMATRLWPDHADLFARVKDDGRAEAALLARWGATK
jgi:crossover junction endodeoxyribonuclease RuvC